MGNATFIDCHCHLFNIVDVPLYATIAGKIRMGTMERFAAALVAGGSILTGIAESKLREYESFIRFFERSIEDNIDWLTCEIRDAVPDGVETVLITPLVMDFDKIHAMSPSGREPTVRDQFDRLKEAIADSVARDGGTPEIKICPFMGLDMRKLSEPDCLPDLEEFWNENGVSTGDRSEGVSGLVSGKALGIKLYPPIGFNPYPQGSDMVGYSSFYRWCCDNDIPLTVHCQPGSYSTGRDRRKVRSLTHSRNWKRVLERLGSFSGLRINFAHFGGEDELEDMLDPWRLDGIQEGTWTHILIQLLKRHPNTYADVSAYDYSERRNRDNLLEVLERDEHGDFGSGEYKLEDKLLWGSDVPMIVSDKAYREDHDAQGEPGYKHYFNSFKKTLASGELDTDTQTRIIAKLTSGNPEAFLLGVA